jgi:hypothetical protein
MYVFKEFSYLIVATSFYAKKDRSKRKFTFNLLTKIENLERFLVIQEIVKDRMEILCKIIKKSFEEKSSLLPSFQSFFFPQFEFNLEFIFRSFLPSRVYPSPVLFFNEKKYSFQFLAM